MGCGSSGAAGLPPPTGPCSVEMKGASMMSNDVKLVDSDANGGKRLVLKCSSQGRGTRRNLEQCNLGVPLIHPPAGGPPWSDMVLAFMRALGARSFSSGIPEASKGCPRDDILGASWHDLGTLMEHASRMRQHGTSARHHIDPVGRASVREQPRAAALKLV